MSTVNLQQKHRFADTLRKLLRRKAVPSLKKILERTHPADVASVLESFLPQERLRLLQYVGDDNRQAHVLACLPESLAAQILTEHPLERAALLLSLMSGDDRADILGVLDDETASKLMKAMPDQESDEAAELLRYGENTAGGIMSPEFLAMTQETTAKEAIRIVQESPDVEMAFYIYVVNVHGSLVGVVSLRQLVTSKPEERLRDIMNPHVVSVRTGEDQEEVARIVSRYDFLAVPVVDDTNCLVGVVTVDDVIDVIREEATEDILKMAGAGEELDDRPAVFTSIKRRVPWLFAALAGGIVAAFVIGRYEETLRQFPLLVGFIPVIIGMAGNVGTQSLTIVVRGLATRRVEVKHFWKVVGRELLVGFLLGILYGLVLGGIAHILGLELGNPLKMAAIIGASVLLAMSMASFVGTATPMLFAKLNIDPAVATGPFLTTTIDVVGVLIYFSFAQALL